MASMLRLHGDYLSATALAFRATEESRFYERMTCHTSDGA
jgi:hypothetical protein